MIPTAMINGSSNPGIHMPISGLWAPFNSTEKISPTMSAINKVMHKRHPIITSQMIVCEAQRSVIIVVIQGF
jgi:hypothetical protein